jgi:hypothetical protein
MIHDNSNKFKINDHITMIYLTMFLVLLLVLIKIVQERIKKNYA